MAEGSERSEVNRGANVPAGAGGAQPAASVPERGASLTPGSLVPGASQPSASPPSASQPSASPAPAVPVSHSAAAISQRLYSDVAFWGLTVTQFLGAFNDNLYKQLMLLLAIRPGQAGGPSEDAQGVATMIFALPFVLGSGYTGYLSDRYSKSTVIRWAKVAEIGVMGLAVVGFLNFGTTGYVGLLAVLFLMGLHSTFFGPGKYGILPELFASSDLPRANGVLLMTTFLAIILGTASAGALKDALVSSDLPPEQAASKLWVGALVCMGIAAVGTATSFLIRSTPPAQPSLRITDWTSLIIPSDTRALLLRDRPLLKSLLATCVFWLVAGVAISGVNSLGKLQFGVSDFVTSTMTATIGLGICVGAVLAGRLSHGGASAGLVRTGAFAIVLLCCLLTFAPAGSSLASLSRGGWAATMAPVYLLLAGVGIAAALFAIPLQVFIQDRPPAEQKGRLIAAMNFANFIAILLSGVMYDQFDALIDYFGWSRSAVFAMMAVLMLPIALIYKPNFHAPRVDHSAA